MACVDDHVVHDAFVNKGHLGLGHSWHAIRPQGLPCPCCLAVARHADPEHHKATEDRPQSFLTPSAVQKHVVNDDGRPTGSNRGKTEIPRRFEVPPFWTDFDLTRFADTKQRSILHPLVGHRPDQVVDAEYQPR